ncbi:MAG: DedD protein [Polaribacter sp.]|jgi:DedD protein
MENSLKQRIVGAIVLVALGVIFLPSILKEKQSNGVFESKIPQKPKVIADYKMDTFNIDELLEKEEIVAKKIQKQAKENKTKADETPDEEIISEKLIESSDVIENSDIAATNNSLERTHKSQKKKSSSAAAWIIQVASFSKHENASKLVEKLKANKQKAYKSRGLIGKNVVYRVFVGPFIKETQAKEAILSINKISGTQSMLKIFNPIKH